MLLRLFLQQEEELVVEGVDMIRITIIHLYMIRRIVTPQMSVANPQCDSTVT